MIKRPTLRDIAILADVSHVAVSMALRSHPKISRATRDKILRIAKEVGYRPDPMLSALIAYRRTARPAHYQGTLAWINGWKPADDLYTSFRRYWEGALARCQELGYQLEEFRLSEYGMKTTALSKVLHARNIQGLLLPPQQRARAHLNMDWDNFSTVSFGYSLARPRFHIITNAQFRSAVLAMRQLRALGYRRIGYYTSQNIEERTDHNFAGGFLVEQLRAKPKDRVPLFCVIGNAANSSDKLEDWCEQHRPQVVMTPDWRVPGWLKKNKLAVAVLGVVADQRGVSGIDQNEVLIGHTAVDFLVGMIHRAERGIPTVPQRILIEGRWIDGQTTPRLHLL